MPFAIVQAVRGNGEVEVAVTEVEENTEETLGDLGRDEKTTGLRIKLQIKSGFKVLSCVTLQSLLATEGT